MSKIKTFKEYIKENLWSDLQDRSSGEVIRKEDRIRTEEELIERIQGEYEKQNSDKTHILDLTMLDVSLVEDMSDLFDGDLTTITALDVSNWDVSNVENMAGIFLNCDNLQILDVSNWDVSNVKDMNHMFCNCVNLQTLDVSNWDVSNVKYMYSMFDGCENLQVLDVSNWDVSNVRTMAYMFYNCENLQVLDVSNWDVSNVAIMRHMFDSCKNLQTLDVSNWDVSNVRTMPFMFFNCENLQTLDVSRWNKEQQEQIPLKLRKVNENLWSDLQDRSSGEVIRKEDDVNLLDLEGMYEYLNSHYRTKYTLITIIEKYNEMIIPIVYRSYPYYITVDFTKHHISVQDSLFLVMPDLMYIIEKEFKLSKYGTRFDQSIRFRIEPKDGSETTNRFLLDVIDFINSKISTQKKCLIKKRLNENLWADLQDRSSGEITRKEDDINHLEFDEFFVYLKDRYEKINGSGAQIGHFRSFYDLSILNIVLSIEKGENIYIKYDENKHQILYLEISNTLLSYPKIKQKLEQNYKRYMNDSVVKKSGKITNQDCVNLIDYFLDVVDKPVLKKKS